MSGTQSGNPWQTFMQAPRLPTPDLIKAADKTKNQWSVQAQVAYSPDDVFYESQDRHHHSGQINVKFPQHWEPMLQEFIAKSPRYRSLQDLVRTALVHQMVYEAMRDVVTGTGTSIKAPILISEIIDNATAAVTAQYDAWERRLVLFEKMCERMVQANDVDGLADELAKYDGDVRETDMLPHFHHKWMRLVGKYTGILSAMQAERNAAA